jgi:hypothetical protein
VIDPMTAKLEFLAPAYNNQNYSNPVSDISFAATGWMLILPRRRAGGQRRRRRRPRLRGERLPEPQ